MMNDAKHLRCPTIFSKLNEIGTQITILTAKHKLLSLLSSNLNPQTSLSFSIEQLQSQTTQSLLQSKSINLIELMGSKPVPGIYDTSISIYLFKLGLKLIQRDIELNANNSNSSLLYYFSTTDYMQHKYIPGSMEANEFMHQFDTILKDLCSIAHVAFTADHGMNDKMRYDGSPRVIYLETLLNEMNVQGRIILPITDPYVVHHGSLGNKDCKSISI
jgi:phosphonoacetate hydrolase